MPQYKQHVLREKRTNLDQTWVRYDSLELDCVDKGFSKCDVLYTRVVEPVDIIPDCQKY